MIIEYSFVTNEKNAVEVDEDLYAHIKNIEREIENSNRKHRRHCYSIDVSVDMHGRDFASPIDLETLILQNEIKAKITSLMSELKSHQVDLLERVFFKNEKTIDIASEYGISRQSVEERLYWILKKLRKRFL